MAEISAALLFLEGPCWRIVLLEQAADPRDRVKALSAQRSQQNFGPFEAVHKELLASNSPVRIASCTAREARSPNETPLNSLRKAALSLVFPISPWSLLPMSCLRRETSHAKVNGKSYFGGRSPGGCSAPPSSSVLSLSSCIPSRGWAS